VIVLSTLLFMAGAPDVVVSPPITIDPCVEVDAEEVRRLTAIELTNWHRGASFRALEVVVACRDGVQELRVTDRVRGQVAFRSIDLTAPDAGDRDAKTRELALAIAELLRRADAEAPPEAPAAPIVPAPAASTVPERSAAIEPVLERWKGELGVAGVGVVWTGGEALFGADLAGRLHVTRWLITELRLGGRDTRPIELENGSMDGHGISAAAGVSLDATPGMHRMGVSFGVRLGVDWLRYAAVNRDDVTYAGKDAAALSVAGTSTAFVVLSDPVCFTIDAAVGGALHSIVIRENDSQVSGMRGILLSSALGLAAQF
jgi:hypothetical protein